MTEPRADLSPVRVPWGQGSVLELEWSNLAVFRKAQIEIAAPDLSGTVENYAASLASALAVPVGSPPLRALVRPGNKVAIVVDDPSRWTPVQAVLEQVLPLLEEAGVARTDVAIVMGVGRHRAVDSAGMIQRLGRQIANDYACHSPPVDDLSAYADVGFTPRGIPIRVFRPVVEADLRVLIGSVLPHLQAGFGGGYKLIVPGSSHRSTLAAVHSQGLDHASGAERLLGSHAGSNPMRLAIHEAVARLGPNFSISHLLGEPGQTLRVLAGDPEQVQDQLAREAETRFRAPIAELADMIVVGNNPWPGDPLQSFKALLHHQNACRKGGVLVGLFWTDPTEFDRSAPLSMLRMISRSGKAGAYMIKHVLPWADRLARRARLPSAFMIRWARELVVDREVLVFAPPVRERLGPRLGPVRLFSNQTALWSAAAECLNRQTREAACIRVFPRGGLTYALATKSESAWDRC